MLGVVCWKTGTLKSLSKGQHSITTLQRHQISAAQWDQPQGLSVINQESTPGAEDNQPKPAAVASEGTADMSAIVCDSQNAIGAARCLLDLTTEISNDRHHGDSDARMDFSCHVRKCFISQGCDGNPLLLQNELCGAIWARNDPQGLSQIQVFLMLLKRLVWLVSRCSHGTAVPFSDITASSPQ